MQCGRVGSRLLSAGAPRILYPRGSFFCACPIFQVSSLCLSGSPISANSYWELSFSFHPFTRERNSFSCCLPCNLHPIPLAFWCWKPGYLTQISWLLDVDCNVIWRRLRHDLRQVGSWYGTGWNVMCCKSRGEAYVLYLWCGDFVVLFIID